MAIIQESVDQSCSPIYTKSTLRKNLQRLFGIVDNTCIITSFKPNLIGEYFVLRTFNNKPQLLKPIIQAAWKLSPRFTTIFLERIIVDFYEFSGNCTYYGIADMDDGIFQKPQMDDIVTETYYANLLVDLSATTVDAKNALSAAAYLQRLLDVIVSVLKKRKEEIYSEIKPFNARNKSSLRIIYQQNKEVDEPPLEKWLFGHNYNENAWYNDFNIKHQDIAGFFYRKLKAHGIFEFLRKTLHDEFLTKKDAEELFSLATQIDQNMVDSGITAITL